MNAQGLKRLLVHLAVFSLIYGYLLGYFTPSHLLSKTTITGGDTPSHYLTAHHLIHTLLPKDKIIGWMPGNYAGFPMFQFYFPLPFLIMAGLNLLMPLQVAFKLVSVLGIFLLPVCAFSCLRLLGFRFPAPITGAIFTIPFLFMEANSAWGGNIPSTLAGEFAYGIGFALLFVYLGLFYKGVTENKYAIANGVLLTLIGLSHACTLIFGVFAATFFLFTTDRFLEKTWYYFKVNALALFLLGFWIVQLLWFIPYTTRFSFVWIIDGILQVFPPILLPVIALAIAGTGWTLVQRIRNKKTTVEEPVATTQNLYIASAAKNPAHAISPVAFLWFICLLATAFYFMAFKMNVVDIRFIPFMQCSLMLLGAVGIYYLTSRLKALSLLPLFLAVVTVLLVNTQVRSISSWIAWNYSGFEQKIVWPAFWTLHEKLKGTCQDPRVAYEHDLKHRAAGSVRAFEMLPYFSGRSTLEGLYIQSTITSPFVFYVQSEISEKPSCPLPDYNYSRLNLEKGLQHLKLFNVSHLVVVTDKVRKALSKSAEVVREADFPPYTIYRLPDNGDRYVSLLDYEPVLLVTREWQQEAFQWFRKSDLKTFVAFKEQLESGDTDRFNRIIHGKLPDTLPPLPISYEASHPSLLRRNSPESSGKGANLGSQDEYRATGQANQGKDLIKEIIRPEEIVIETQNIGLPHLVRISYHPNWRVEGADRIYLVSPSFMLFNPSFPNYLGHALSLLGVLLAVGCALLEHRFRICGSRLENSTKLESRMLDRVQGLLPRRLHDLVWKKRLLWAIVITIIGAMTGFILLGQQNDATILYNKGLAHYTKKDYQTARKIFEEAMKLFPYSPIIDQTAFHYAAAYFREEKWQDALEAFQQMAADYPETRKLSEVLYHIGICKMRLHRTDEAVSAYERVLEEFPDERWAGYAKERLKEIRKISAQTQRTQ
jgi:tetratricopeptide (TPR) repeat protein